MLQLVPHMKILVAVEPIDFRRGLYSIAALCRARFAHDPLSGAVLVFRNRSGTAIRVVLFDGVGWWFVTRRFSQGRLTFWPSSCDTQLHPLAAHELAVILYNGDPQRARFAEPWRRLA
jgi:transposase